MAQQNSDALANSLIAPSRREVEWPVVFAGVKNVVRANNLNNDTLTCIKAWLKANDSQFLLPLLSLTVLHTMSLNCSTAVRNQLAAPRLFQRLEKQLVKPQGPQVATAIVQVLVDWAHLFGAEELGVRSRALLAQPRFGVMAAGCAPSPAVASMGEEMRLGIPPVAPIRGEDFIRAMYRGASADLATLSTGGGANGGTPRVQPGCIPGGAPPPITSHAVPLLCSRMKTDAHRLMAALAACRAAARGSRQGELAAAMDGAYREAERCSQWRRRVQDFTQQDDNPAALSSVLSATDVINVALREWQDFASGEVYHLLRITVPPMSAAALRQSISPSSAAASQPRRHQQQPALATAAGRASDVADLLNMGVTLPAAAAPPPPAAAAHIPHSQSASQIGSEFDPFGDPPPRVVPGASAGSNHHGAQGVGGGGGGAAPVGFGFGAQLAAPSANPFANSPPVLPTPPTGAPGSSFTRPAAAAPAAAPAAAAAGPPSRPTHHAQPSLSDWDPFQSPAPPPPQASAFRTATAPGLANPAAPSGGTDWTLFDAADAPGSISPALTSTRQSGSLPSPSHSGLSVTSTPIGSAASGLVSPRSTAATPQQPATAHLPQPQPAAAAAAATAAFASSPQLATGPHRPQGGAGGGAATGSAAAALNRSATAPAHPATAAGAGPSGSNDRSTFPEAPTSSSSGFDWRPEFDSLAAELRALAAAAPPPLPHGALPPSAAAAGPPLAEVLSRVRGLCEQLAAKHVRCVAELGKRHEEELRDVKSRALAKLREVTSSGPAAAGGGGVTAGPLSGDGGGGGGGGAVGVWPGAAASGPGRGNAAAAAAAAVGPLLQGLQLHQQSLLHPHAPLQAQQPQPHKPNGYVAAAPVSASGANGRTPPADFSLI